MKSYICDICGVSVGEHELTTLIEDFQTEYIKDVCKDCYETISDANTKIRNTLGVVHSSWIKKIILRLKGEKG